MFLILAVGTALALSCSFYPTLGLPRGRRLAVLAILTTLILLTPLIVPPDRRFPRLLAGVLAVALSVKLFDLYLGADRGFRPGFRAAFLFLINLTSVVLRKLGDEPQPTRRENLRRLMTMTFAAVPVAVLLAACYRVDWRPVPFAVEHSAKVLAFFLTLVPAGAAGAAVWRLLGNSAREPMDNPFASTTPADFWKRYNRPARQFFLEDVFKPLGGRRHPIRGTLATFAVSGLIHEFLFDITVMRIQGYQMAFFLIQGVAVALTLKVRPKGWVRIFAIGATLAFNLATGALFFASIDEVLPFYERRPTLAPRAERSTDLVGMPLTVMGREPFEGPPLPSKGRQAALAPVNWRLQSAGGGCRPGETLRIGGDHAAVGFRRPHPLHRRLHGPGGPDRFEFGGDEGAQGIFPRRERHPGLGGDDLDRRHGD